MTELVHNNTIADVKHQQQNIPVLVWPVLGCNKTSVWEIIWSVQVLVASARARSASRPGSSDVLSVWPRVSPVYCQTHDHQHYGETMTTEWRTTTQIFISDVYSVNMLRSVTLPVSVVPARLGWWTDQRPRPAASGPWWRLPRSLAAPFGGPSPLEGRRFSPGYKKTDGWQQPPELVMVSTPKRRALLTRLQDGHKPRVASNTRRREAIGSTCRQTDRKYSISTAPYPPFSLSK